ncbi:polyamine ABC transporter ATP-binding protein [Sinorhizobium medicae]|uniref:Spermidine/putrescine import ATP-binding protein PotA n=1 Tax=Sinorhizobium medicae (strain WSM419) TaxID=366394 RepID=A6UMN1_SINMW|nr:ABC transporter ATP-binding protein [Sinorhizobium medicae]ABR64911.1 spermidine/putrescine ABC transporter ATPase subunit [Sinorhizobium medicae WSM419]MBO1945196.1 ABC transporter ATP-binding protein [Sinorhizobium medicae]MDX0405005.1 polyamine ABC transporter ATP-binding protein [Sinorhizobium medicae]MDX0412001.1 polyamine ABC transporter ATP-binding protein [Sinorhizobium medicae]MDX0416685.1 polyamine ABC transporter ATP-binding protein [Sinorhizobium medicae]
MGVVAADVRRAGSIDQVAVSVKDVGMAFGDVHAVRNASFDLPQGRFLTILGPSGSGKTTLLRMIAGFDRPTSGEIFINGQPVSAVPPHKRAIGMVFQKLALFPHMTAAENVAFPLKMRRHDARTIPEKVERYLDLVRLGGYGDRRINELSGGQQQRVAIARALVFEPDLLLLDEPLAALDRKLREEMQLEFRRIQKELGVTTINVTHDQREALVVSDEIIVMNGGAIQQKARPVDAYRAPSNAFVANFIGVTNFLEGRIVELTSTQAVFETNGVRLVGIAADAALVAGLSCSGALRAEQIRIAPRGGRLDELETVVDGQVVDCIFEGDRVVYEIRVPDLAGVLMRVFDHDPESHLQFGPGDEVRLGWNARDMHVFQK